MFVTLPSPFMGLQHAPLPPKCYESGSVPQLLTLPIPHPKLTFESIKELGNASLMFLVQPMIAILFVLWLAIAIMLMILPMILLSIMLMIETTNVFLLALLAMNFLLLLNVYLLAKTIQKMMSSH